MTTLEMQYKAANERLEASLEQRDAERSEMRMFLRDLRDELLNGATRNMAISIIESEMNKRNIVW